MTFGFKTLGFRILAFVWILVFGFWISVLAGGCAKVAPTSDAGSPPAGTTQVKLSTSNISVSGTSLSCNLTALDQSNTVLSGLKTGNLIGKIYSNDPSISSVTSSTTQTATATLVFTAVSGGSSGTTKNVDAALVIDKSGSMGFDDGTYKKVTSAEVAARSFVSLEASSSASNKVAVILFDTDVSVESAMRALDSTGVVTTNTAIDKRTGYGTRTALFYAIVNGVNEASKEAVSSSRVRAVVALTDGCENESPTAYNSTTEVINAAVASSIPVYTVGLFDTTDEATTNNSDTGGTYRGDLQQIALGTTGSSDNYFEIITAVTPLSVNASSVTGLAAMSDLYQKIATALTQSYTVTATLSTSLAAGSYWLVLELQNYGSFTGQQVILKFVKA